MKVITITLDETADQVVETDGYHGKGCSAVTKAFADAVGATAGPITRKKEYWFVATVKNLLKEVD